MSLCKFTSRHPSHTLLLGFPFMPTFLLLDHPHRFSGASRFGEVLLATSPVSAEQCSILPLVIC